MDKPKIIRYYLAGEEKLKDLEFEFDTEGKRPAWISLKDASFKPRFLSVRTKKQSEIIYKRFAGGFYYPTEWQIKPLEEERFYQKYAQVYDEHVAKNNLPMAEFLLKKFFQLNIPKTAKILDLGSGTGLFSELAAKAGYTQLTLLDRSKAMLDVAKKKKALGMAKFVVGDALDIKLDDIYDVVVSVMMFDVISSQDLPQVLENVRKHLTAKGYLFLVEDKARTSYKHFFQEMESGLKEFDRGLTKYYFIGQKKKIF